MNVRTRFAPSPTGDLHIGGVRTALFSWLYARHYGGKFVLRIEDTDQERSTQEAVDVILRGLEWLGLDSDEKPVFQSHRFTRYTEISEQLLQKGMAYRCYCTLEELEAQRKWQKQQGLKPRYNRKCRDLGADHKSHLPSVVRFMNPITGSVSFSDKVRGSITVDNGELDDLIIIRTDGTPTYNFSVVVDDLDMEITHVIRGDDHLNNTPRQINIFAALGAPMPTYAHVPMIMGHDGQRLSKRHGSASVLKYENEGFLPEAINNYIVRLGWSSGDQEIFSIDEMIEKFDIVNVNRAPSAFSIEKLRWLNQHYIQIANTSRLEKMLSARLKNQQINTHSGPPLTEVINVLRKRVETLEELTTKSLYFFEEFGDYDQNAAKKHLRPVILPVLIDLLELLKDLNDWKVESIHNLISKVAEKHDLKLGKVAQPLRVLVSGVAATPPIDETVALIGKNKTIRRLEDGLNYIRKRSEKNA